LRAPMIDEINPERLARVVSELEERGFKDKAINLSFIESSTEIVADEVEKVSVADAMGIESVPVIFNFFTDVTATLHCGVAPPLGQVGALGLKDPGGKLPPDPIPTPPADRVDPPQEILLPDPPQPEQPVSGN